MDDEQDNLVEMSFPAKDGVDPDQIIGRQDVEADLLEALFEIGVSDRDLMDLAEMLRTAGNNHVGKPLTVIALHTDPESPLEPLRIGLFMATTLWLKNPGVIDRRR